MGFGSLSERERGVNDRADFSRLDERPHRLLDRSRDRAFLCHCPRAQGRSCNREALAQQAHKIDFGLRAMEHGDLQQPAFEREQIDVAAEVRARPPCRE